MSTNNNHSSRTSKDVLPKWLTSINKEQSLPKISGDKLNRMMSNLTDITALTLSNRQCTQIVDLQGMSKLRRLDISGNKLKRLAGMRNVTDIGMLNASNNNLQGSQSMEELRYLPELRTLNIGYNPQITHLESHIVKGKLAKLQALICNECGFKSVSFLKFCVNLNTLILSQNSLTVFPTSNDFSMNGLTKLSLSKNNLQQIPNLSVCVNLQELRINNNEISSISESITIAPKLKILDISNNKIDSWASVECLLKLTLLTNLSINGNPLPSPPHTFDETPLREDYSVGRIDDADTKRYRHHILSLFQIQVGAEEKTKVRLIVLDSKRVKMKWSHSVNPDSELLDDAVDLQDINVGTMNSTAEGGDNSHSHSHRNGPSHRLPKKSKSTVGRLSRSGQVKEEEAATAAVSASVSVSVSREGKSSKKRKHQSEQGDDNKSLEKEEKKEKKKKSKKRKQLEKQVNERDQARDPSGSTSLSASTVNETAGRPQFSHDSGVVGVEFQVTGREEKERGNVDNNHDLGEKKKHKKDRAKTGGGTGGGVDLSLLSGSSNMQGFGTGGSSAWD